VIPTLSTREAALSQRVTGPSQTRTTRRHGTVPGASVFNLTLKLTEQAVPAQLPEAMQVVAAARALTPNKLPQSLARPLRLGLKAVKPERGLTVARVESLLADKRRREASWPEVWGLSQTGRVELPHRPGDRDNNGPFYGRAALQRSTSCVARQSTLGYRMCVPTAVQVCGMPSGQMETGYAAGTERISCRSRCFRQWTLGFVGCTLSGSLVFTHGLSTTTWHLRVSGQLQAWPRAAEA